MISFAPPFAPCTMTDGGGMAFGPGFYAIVPIESSGQFSDTGWRWIARCQRMALAASADAGRGAP